jgi:hypothetical protein
MTRRASATTLFLIVALASSAGAIQPDAAYQSREKQFAEEWKAEDQQVPNQGPLGFGCREEVR